MRNIRFFFCNKCNREYTGCPNIEYENPNEELGEGIVLIEKGEYQCKICNNIIAIYRVNLNPSHYNLAILDIRIPGLNGLQLYYRLKAINRNIKVLFVSVLDAVPEFISILPDVKDTNDFIKKACCT
jgi:DNA-binding NtrC family response regulator